MTNSIIKHPQKPSTPANTPRRRRQAKQVHQPVSLQPWLPAGLSLWNCKDLASYPWVIRQGFTLKYQTTCDKLKYQHVCTHLQKHTKYFRLYSKETPDTILHIDNTLRISKIRIGEKNSVWNPGNYLSPYPSFILALNNKRNIVSLRSWDDITNLHSRALHLWTCAFCDWLQRPKPWTTLNKTLVQCARPPSKKDTPWNIPKVWTDEFFYWRIIATKKIFLEKCVQGFLSTKIMVIPNKMQKMTAN